MYLSNIADKLAEAINTSSPGNWEGGIVLPSVTYPVITSLDPSVSLRTEEGRGVYIIPAYNEYDLSRVRKAGKRQGKVAVGQNTIKRIILGISSTFENVVDTNSMNDVAPKSEWSLLTNLREDLEKFVINTELDGYELIDIEPEPLDEDSMDNRIFLAMTVLGYKAC
jgi:hypothetical protein